MVSNMEVTTTIFLLSETGTTLLIALIVAMVTGFVTYWFGFRQYLKQGRRETIRRTYIEAGLEKVLEGTDRLSTACYLNYGKANLVFELLENTVIDPKKVKETSRKIFLEMEGATLMPNYGVLKLAIFNNQSLIILVTQMWIEFQQLEETIRHIGWQSIEYYFSGYQNRSEDERRKYLAEQRQVIRDEWNKVIRKYEPLKGQLLRLQIEVDKMDLLLIEDLDKIAERCEVKAILNEIERTYQDSINKFKTKFRDSHE